MNPVSIALQLNVSERFFLLFIEVSKVTVHCAEIKTKSIENKNGHKLYLDLVEFYKNKTDSTKSIGYIFRYKKEWVAYIGGSQAEHGTPNFQKFIGTRRIGKHIWALTEQFLYGIKDVEHHIYAKINGHTKNLEDIEIIVLNLGRVPSGIFEACTQAVESTNKNNPYYVNTVVEGIPPESTEEILNTREKQNQLAAFLMECIHTNIVAENVNITTDHRKNRREPDYPHVNHTVRKGNFICDTCGKSFATSTLLSKHIPRVHDANLKSGYQRAKYQKSP